MDCTICVRFTAEEAAEIAERAAAPGRMTTGGYFRRRALEKPVHEATVHHFGARDRVKIYRIGVNLNQIARALNSGVRCTPVPVPALDGAYSPLAAPGQGIGPPRCSLAQGWLLPNGSPPLRTPLILTQTPVARVQGAEAGEAGPALLAQLGEGRDA